MLRYCRGAVYLAHHQGAEAAAEFQKVMDHRGYSTLSPVYPAAMLGLARAAALTGDLPKSRKAYQNLFALWKDADSDLPTFIAARSEYQKLPAN
jgi:eukaryotic-like serine/threonine-protein kinase